MGSAREIALDLMDRLLSGELLVSDFCAQYEQHFNFDWPDRGVEDQAELFRKLFKVVVWYSPYPDERKTIPNYTSESDVLGTVQAVRSQVAA